MFGRPAGSMRYCDGVNRRSFLRAGLAAGMFGGGLSLPQLLQAEQRAGIQKSHKAVIMVYLSGGMSHQDSFDLKPNAPDGIRGEFKPIDSTVPGMPICELMPELALQADRFAVIRSLVGQRDEHSSFQSITGHSMGESQRQGLPHFGSFVSRIQGPTNPVVPAFIDLFPTMQHRPYNSPGPGFLGPKFAGVRADGEDLASMKLRFGSASQLNSRKQLLQCFDKFRREVDDLDLAGSEASYAQAFDVLTSSRLVDALDVEKEDPKIRERYGKGSSKHQGDGAPLWNDQLLVARRLVEAGVRVVTVAYGFWDTHGGNFSHLRQNLPVYDRGVSALIEDLHDRGLADDVSVVVWGEFGRTPKINKDAGRDHWARVNSVLLAGGGMRTGQYIGTTDNLADSAKDRPVHYLDVLATVYRNLGIDPLDFVRDATDRPIQPLPTTARAVRELV